MIEGQRLEKSYPMAVGKVWAPLFLDPEYGVRMRDLVIFFVA